MKVLQIPTGEGDWMTSQLTRDACKSFRRRLDIKLVCMASPTAKSLKQVVRNTIASGYVAAPMLKLWLEKLPSIPAVKKICRSQSVRIE